MREGGVESAQPRSTASCGYAGIRPAVRANQIASSDPPRFDLRGDRSGKLQTALRATQSAGSCGAFPLAESFALCAACPGELCTRPGYRMVGHQSGRRSGIRGRGDLGWAVGQSSAPVAQAVRQDRRAVARKLERRRSSHGSGFMLWAGRDSRSPGQAQGYDSAFDGGEGSLMARKWPGTADPTSYRGVRAVRSGREAGRGTGRLNRKPWPCSQPTPARNSCCASVSIPSATTSSPSARPVSATARTIAVSSRSCGTPRHQRTVELHHRQRQPLQHREAREPGAEIVERDARRRGRGWRRARSASPLRRRQASIPSAPAPAAPGPVPTPPKPPRLGPAAPPSWSCRAETFTETISGSGQVVASAAGARSTQPPIGVIRPLSSASGMNAAGETRPRRRCGQRISASAATTRRAGAEARADNADANPPSPPRAADRCSSRRRSAAATLASSQRAWAGAGGGE